MLQNQAYLISHTHSRTRPHPLLPKSSLFGISIRPSFVPIPRGEFHAERGTLRCFLKWLERRLRRVFFKAHSFDSAVSKSKCNRFPSQYRTIMFALKLMETIGTH